MKSLVKRPVCLMLQACLAVSCLLTYAHTASSATNFEGLEWKAPIARDHPLVGEIHNATGSMTLAALADLMADSRFVLIGEKHDNVDHHQLELYLLKSLVEQKAADNTPAAVAVAFEMLNSDQQLQLTGLMEQLVQNDSVQIEAKALKDSLDWPEHGWPWDDYSELIGWALNSRLSLYAGNISQKTMRTIYQSGIDDRFESARQLKASVSDALLDQVFQGHCGLMPRDALSSMVDIQLVKDSAMANALVAGNEQLNVLVAGTGHIRKDTSVPKHLQLIDNQSTLAVALIEVEIGKTSVADYDELFDRFDVVVFTPIANQRDYCADLKKSMQKQ